VTSRAVVRHVRAVRRLLQARRLSNLSGEVADELRDLVRELNGRLPGLP
jgi:hypothetical protein